MAESTGPTGNFWRECDVETLPGELLAVADDRLTALPEVAEHHQIGVVGSGAGNRDLLAIG